MLSSIKEIWRYKEMLRTLVFMDLRTKYKGSILGFLWTFLNPLMTILIYTLIFHTIMRVSMPHYLGYVFVGQLPWNFFQTAMLAGTGSILQYANMVKKIYFPRQILPLSIVLSNGINYLLSLIILIPALLVTGVSLSWHLIWFPVILAAQFILLYPMVLLLSALQVYMRDIQHMLVIFLTAWFYFTPVIYSMEMVPKRYAWVYDLNPAKPLIQSYQDIFYYHRSPSWVLFAWVLIAVAGTFVAQRIFNHLNRRMAEEV
ncbi:MAG: type transporter [Bacilli bacterium]|nr:type transporter [Bacilli bacterium]